MSWRMTVPAQSRLVALVCDRCAAHVSPWCVRDDHWHSAPVWLCLQSRGQGSEKAELRNYTTCRWHDLNYYRASLSFVLRRTDKQHATTASPDRLIKEQHIHNCGCDPGQPYPWSDPTQPLPDEVCSPACCPPFQHRFDDGLPCSCVGTVANVQAVGDGRWRGPE